ncbi:beta-glucosidase family protein [Phytoactinopolyspora mesophila]|uniref:Glycosyl hydrolase n=1 Tax=Phytoactinopolyspora mesophila TaxID=2650750 RepID=A0A7K3M744_9ACTN|nr:glycoside hydrolase family 3 C-terminal domain-containing protein [Phytoactinopolyspora mesophila]NDL58752.1 glycosyl hydrolase [Phytoactinopolyspora mesophila]
MSQTHPRPAGVDDETLPALVARLTLEQKVRLLTGADMWGLYDEPAIGLRRMVLSDGPSGIRGEHFDGRETSINLPSATALGASWDVELAYRYGALLVVEARRRGADVVLGPTINLHRSPLGGRHFEAYSEDPLLTSRLAAAYVRAVQDGGVGACPKHYIANDFETERFTADVVVSERALRELYLAAFENIVRQERPWMVMAAYNSVNGATMTENPLLGEPLRGEWGFDGVVVSDWWATQTTEGAALGELDLVMPGPDGPWGDKLVEAVSTGRVPEVVIDRKVLHLLSLAGRVGALDGVAPAVVVPSKEDGRAPVEDGPALVREAAAAGMVLVRNAGGELPWQAASLGRVAVIGHNAFHARTQGGGSAVVEPDYTVAPLDGLRGALPGTEVVWALGAAIQRAVVPLPEQDLTDPVTGERGVRVIFRDPDGAEILSEWRRGADLARLASPRLLDHARVQLCTRYRPTRTEDVRLGVAGAGRVRMHVDGRLVLDAELVHEGQVFAGGLLAPPVASVPVSLTAGTPIDIEISLEVPADRPEGAATLTLGFDLETAEPDQLMAEAVETARTADAAVVVVGTSSDVESEGFDRKSLALPGRQDELVHAVAAVNPRTVVVVNSGAPVTMPWRDEVAAVLLTWFGGQEYGNALADVLLGVREPGGRLPTTWPAAESDVPILDTTPVNGTLRYDEGIHIGYRAWLRSGVSPAYPFGYGLGYTTWDLTDLTVSRPAGDRWEAQVRVRNTGMRVGKHVVQVYLSRPGSGVERQERWLAGFAVVRAEPGEEQNAVIEIASRAFQHWDGGWQVEPGSYTLYAGSHVADLPLSTRVDVE